MTVSPQKLQHYCLKTLCEDVESLCAEQELNRSFEPRYFLPTHLSEEFLSRLNRSNKLCDRTLLLFNSTLTNLRKIDIRNAGVSVRSLQVLRQHKLVDVRTVGLKNVSVDDIISCLNTESLASLRHLNVSNCTFVTNAKLRAPVIVSLSKLRNLHSLNVSHTEFNETGIDIVSQCLPSLQVLDVSCTPITETEHFSKFKHRLKSLTLHNLHINFDAASAQGLMALTSLQHLDVSCDYFIESPEHIFGRPCLDDFVSAMFDLPQLVSLDLSGHLFSSKLLQ